MSESKNPNNAPADGARHKVRVEESPHHQFTFETAGVNLLNRALDEFCGDTSSTALSHEPSAILWRQPTTSAIAGVGRAAQIDHARPTFGGRSFAGVLAHAARRLAIQPKLMVSPAGDQYVQEADRVAGQVMKVSAVPRPIQRSSANCCHEP